MSTYTGTVETDTVYDMMTQHAKVSMEANELAFERMFDTDEMDPEARLASLKRELELVTQANSLAFNIANAFMDEGFVEGFRDRWDEQHANEN